MELWQFGVLAGLALIAAVIGIVSLAAAGKKSKDETGPMLRETAKELRRDISSDVKNDMVMTGRMNAEHQKQLTEAQNSQIKMLQNTVTDQMTMIQRLLKAQQEQNTVSAEEMRRTMQNGMEKMQESNEKKLDQMRQTVDEKLQKTLEERIAHSFEAVNRNLEAVYKGLGDMKNLAGDVGSLKQVLSNVKTRGTLGEIQLGSILSEILAPEQYDTNVVTIPGTRNPVEFAVKMPGDGDGHIYLPIDSKFPLDTYQHLTDAYDTGDADTVNRAWKELETRICSCAKDIRDKYVAPPYTTDFGIMFLPIEGLYAEVVRHGMVEKLQRQYRINIAGPTTMAALLNSLQMGFRTLAIQKRSGEVTELLAAVKTEFGKFAAVLEKHQTHLKQASDDLDRLVGTRTNAINRCLRDVDRLPEENAEQVLFGDAK